MDGQAGGRADGWKDKTDGTHMRRLYIHTYIHAYVHTYIHTYVHTYVHKYITT
jgi:hypothetical protein